MIVADKIKGSKKLTEIFGAWPSFHDAEVLQVSLDRAPASTEYGPTLEASIYVFQMTSEVDKSGHYILKNKVVATIRFSEVCELKLAEFNHQNALMGLSISDISKRQMERQEFQVSFEGSFGIDLQFQCYEIEVLTITPYSS